MYLIRNIHVWCGYFCLSFSVFKKSYFYKEFFTVIVEIYQQEQDQTKI